MHIPPLGMLRCVCFIIHIKQTGYDFIYFALTDFFSHVKGSLLQRLLCSDWLTELLLEELQRAASESRCKTALRWFLVHQTQTFLFRDIKPSNETPEKCRSWCLWNYIYANCMLPSINNGLFYISLHLVIKYTGLMYWVTMDYTGVRDYVENTNTRLEMYTLRCLCRETNKAVIAMTLKLTSEQASYNLLNKLHPFLPVNDFLL